MREERDTIKSELTQLKDELAARDGFIDNLKSQLEEKETAIATLTTENQKLEGYLAEAAKNEIFLSEELQRFKYGIVPGEEPQGEQLQLFPPEEQAAVTPEPEPEELSPPEETENDTTEVLQSEISLLDSVEGTVSASGLMEHIKDMKKRNRNFPDPPEKTQTFTDAVTGKTKRLKELETTYGFKLVGYVMKGSRREYRYKILDN